MHISFNGSFRRLSFKTGSMTKDPTMQICSTPGCQNPAAYRTRNKPTYCLECIDRIVDESGLVREAPFKGPKEWVLTRCKACGVEAHYRFEHILEKHNVKEPVCRACYWKRWFRGSWTDFGVGQGLERPIPRDAIERYANECGFELLDMIPGEVAGEDLYHVKCRACGRLSVERFQDLIWGCTCSKPTREERDARKRFIAPYLS